MIMCEKVRIKKHVYEFVLGKDSLIYNHHLFIRLSMS